jgi:biotin carboxyl carrier protein
MRPVLLAAKRLSFMSSNLPTPEEKPIVAETVSATESSRRRWLGVPVINNGILWASTPALALFGLVALSSQTSLPTPLGMIGNTDGSSGSSVISAREWVVPASQTILISNQSAGDYMVLRGRLEATGGEKIVSKTSGEVVQTLVQPGQFVKAGQKIVMLTTGIAPPVTTSSPLDEWQERAESAQIAAAKQQEKLESRMTAANEEMERAKQRVAEAQKRVTQARELIAKLQNGEEVSHSTTVAKPVATTTPSRPSASARANARRAAVKETQKLQDDASWAEQQAQTAQKAARKAQDQVDARQQKLQVAMADLKATEKKPNAGIIPDNDDAPDANESDNADATKAVSEARQALSIANSRAAAAQRDAARLQARAQEARNKANDAARRATQDLQVFEDQAQSAPVAVEEPVRNRSGKVTVADAMQLARAAMKESEDAIADAERIRRKVENYSRPVQNTRRQFERATEKLEAAQRRMWENVPQMRTTQSAITADRDGVVTWVVADKTVVKPGEALVTVGRPDHLQVVITDKSGIWKSLKANMQVLALVQRQGKSVEGAQTQSGSAESGINIPSMARVLAVAPPASKRGAARVRLAVHNPPQQIGNNQNGLSPRAFKPGMPVFFSVSKPSQNTALHIPTAAVRRAEGGKTYVAVLSPLQNQKRDRLADQCRVEWREVLLAPGDGRYNRVKSGLEIGERVALQPNELYSFTLAYGEQATVRVEQI